MSNDYEWEQYDCEECEEWVTVVSKRDKKILALEEEKKKACEKAFNEISKVLSHIKQMKAEAAKQEKARAENAIVFISPKTFMNRLTRGGRRINQSDIQARERVSYLISHIRSVNEKEQNAVNTTNATKTPVLLWNSIIFEAAPVNDIDIENAESILRHLDI
jgi:chlorite dismutase